MKYIMFDNIEGTILGLDIEKQPDYVTLTDEGYEFILRNNGICYIKTDIANNRLEESKNSNNPEYCVIDMSCITTEKRYDIIRIIESIIEKNVSYCNMYITNGIHFTLENGKKKKYKYELEDQANMEQLMRLINNDSLNDETGIPIKASGESEYDLLSVSEFRRLYDELIRHKYYHLFYMRQYNEYIKTITSEIELHRCQYGMELPDEYIDKINKQLENFKEII